MRLLSSGAVNEFVKDIENTLVVSLVLRTVRKIPELSCLPKFAIDIYRNIIPLRLKRCPDVSLSV